MKNITLGFWAYSALMAITILNDRLSLLNLLFSAIYVSTCLAFSFKVIKESQAARCMFVFPIIYILYVFMSPDIHADLNSKWGMLNWTLKVMLTFFPAYYFGKMNILSLKQLRYIGVILLIIGIISYYLNVNLVLMDQDGDEEGITNNVGYLFVAILPILFINIKKNLVFIVLTYLFVLISMKRGAIVCALATIPFLIYILRRHLRVSKVVVIMGLAISSFALYYVVQRAAHENSYVEYRIESTIEGNTSGRDDYAIKIWDELNKFDVTEYILGKGINYSFVVLDNFAHNDWLEIMLSMGILGCLSYFFSFWGMFIYCKKECFHEFKVIGFMIIMIALLRTVLSMNYFSLDSIPLYYTLGLIYKREEICIS